MRKAWSHEGVARWAVLLERLRGRVDDVDWRGVAIALRAQIGRDRSSGGELDPALVALVRRLSATRTPEADGGDVGVDPWRVDVVLRIAELDRHSRLRRSPLWTSTMPRHGVLEPDTHLRAWASARALVEAMALAAGRPAADALSEDDAAPVVWWWLTGEDAPEASLLHERRNRAEVAAQVHLALAPLALLSSTTRETREASIRGWQGIGGAGSRGAAAGRDRVSDAVGVCRAALQRKLDEAVSAAGELLPAIATQDTAETSTPLAAWALRGWALGVVAEAKLDDPRLRQLHEVTAAGLVEDLERMVEDPRTLSTQHQDSFLFWRGWSVLLRDRADVGDVGAVQSLLRSAAETGAWNEPVRKHLRRALHVIDAMSPEHRSSLADAKRGFVLRLALTSARRRGATAEKLWKTTLRGFVASPPETPEKDALRAWWEPGTGELARSASTADLLQLTRELAASEVEAPTWPGRTEAEVATEAVRWWSRPDVAMLPQPVARGAAVSAIRLVRAELADRALRAGAVPIGGGSARERLCLLVQQAAGMNHEQYVRPVLVKRGEGGVTLAATEELYGGVLLDRSDELAALRVALRSVLDAGRDGRRPDIRAIDTALGQLLSQAFRAELARSTAAGDAVVEIAGHDDAVPWEMLPIPIQRAGLPDTESLPLSAVARACRTRPRPAGSAPPLCSGPPRSLLVLHHPGHPGVSTEVDLVTRAWSAPGHPLVCRAVSTVGEVDRALDERGFDVVHYAGHMGSRWSGEPALTFADGTIALRHVLERLDHQPPGLLFLHACSSASPSRLDPRSRASPADREPHHGRIASLGTLEPIRDSRIPTVIGTLWDVAPPADHALVTTFYRALAAGSSPADAMWQARKAVRDRPAWDGWWQAYVVYGGSD